MSLLSWTENSKCQILEMYFKIMNDNNKIIIIISESIKY